MGDLPAKFYRNGVEEVDEELSKKLEDALLNGHHIVLLLMDFWYLTILVELKVIANF